VPRMWGIKRRAAIDGPYWISARIDCRSPPECAVVDLAPHLRQQVGASPGPSHLLRFIHPSIDQEVGCAFGRRGPDAKAGSVSFGIVDEPRALAAEIVVDLA
jgi:hypothetical protein